MKALVMLVLVLAIGCGEQQIVNNDAGVQDAGRGFYEEDGGENRGDADQPDAPDSGADAAEGTDAGGAVDSGPEPADAGADEDAGSDAGPGADAAPVEDAGPEDAGPPRPVGVPVDVTGSRCALDSVGSMWCWGRWTPVEDVRLLGTGFDAAWGSCALRGREVWCAEFTTLTMIPVMENSAVLEVSSIAEYSDLERGCGLRTTPEGWGEAVCWTDGGAVVREGGTGTTIVAVSATAPREVLATSGAYEAYDINPPATCSSDSTRATCVRDTGGSYDAARPAGDHYVLGFGLSCAHGAGSTTCSTALAGTPVSIPDDGVFHDQAVSWPIGAVGSRPHEARGICIGSNNLHCYDDSGTLAYTVTW